ncbi:MAG: hypothetical protein ACP5IE_05760 [Infirmifilum sp.]
MSLNSVDVDPTTALSFIVKAMRDEGFRNFFLTLLYQYMGDHLKTITGTYIVSEDNIKNFETLLSNKSKSTKGMLFRDLKRALSDLGHGPSPDRIREVIAEAETPNIARHMTDFLKLFIKDDRERKLWRIYSTYSSFMVPKGKYKHMQERLI